MDVPLLAATPAGGSPHCQRSASAKVNRARLTPFLHTVVVQVGGTSFAEPFAMPLIALAVAVVALLVSAFGGAPSSTVRAAATDGGFTVMTFNVQHGMNTRG